MRDEVQSHIKYRQRFHPIEYPCAGSTFKNIPLALVSAEVRAEFADVVKIDPVPVIPVAAILDRLGLKGKRIGGAEISTKHPNFFINRDKATFSNIVEAIALAKTMAWQRYGIVLEEEIRIVR
jgi:UDP-N-acetylmuramate dehydrogenase